MPSSPCFTPTGFSSITRGAPTPQNPPPCSPRFPTSRGSPSASPGSASSASSSTAANRRSAGRRKPARTRKRQGKDAANPSGEREEALAQQVAHRVRRRLAGMQGRFSHSRVKILEAGAILPAVQDPDRDPLLPFQRQLERPHPVGRVVVGRDLVRH